MTSTAINGLIANFITVCVWVLQSVNESHNALTYIWEVSRWKWESTHILGSFTPKQSLTSKSKWVGETDRSHHESSAQNQLFYDAVFVFTQLIIPFLFSSFQCNAMHSKCTQGFDKWLIPALVLESFIYMVLKKEESVSDMNWISYWHTMPTN